MTATMIATAAITETAMVAAMNGLDSTLSHLHVSTSQNTLKRSLQTALCHMLSNKQSNYSETTCTSG